MCVGCLLSLGVVPNISTASSCLWLFFIKKCSIFFDSKGKERPVRPVMNHEQRPAGDTNSHMNI